MWHLVKVLGSEKFGLAVWHFSLHYFMNIPLKFATWQWHSHLA